MSTLSETSQDNIGWVYPPQPQTQITVVEESIGIINGLAVLVDGQDYVDVVFGSAQPSDEWVLIETSIFNTTDSTPVNVWPGVITSKTETGFRLQLNGTPDSDSYILSWAIRGVFGYSCSGPTSGLKSVASSAFTLQLIENSGLTGTVVITPSTTGGGTFTPSTISLTVESPIATFTYTPSSIGTKIINFANDRGLTNPASRTYISSNPAATTYTFSGPSSGGVGVESTDFTVALPADTSVPSSVTITPDDAADGGTFTPSTVELTTAAPSATFTYTPASGGDKTLSVSNDGGLTDPGSLTYTVALVQHLLDTLISYWKMDEASGTRVDSQGSNDLTPAGAPGSGTGVINDAAVFVSASNQYLSCTSNSTLQITSDFTFSVWVKLTALTNETVLCRTAPAVGNEYTLAHQPFPTKAFLFFVGPLSADSDAAEAPEVTVGVWTHLVCWFDSATGEVYMRVDDTTTYASTTCPGLVSPTTADFIIGQYSSANFLDGYIDEVGFWKRTLTAEEITSLYNGGAGLPFSSFLP